MATTTKSKRRIVHMPARLWNEASTTASTLGLSTSQFLSRLVIETAGEISRGGMLGRPMGRQRDHTHS